MRSIIAMRRLYPALQEHRLVEAETRRLLEQTLEPRYLVPAGPAPGMLKYAQRNFFSTLFLAIYKAVGIDRERRLFYGVLNHAIRGIVTGTDNLLDDEYKEMLPLRFPAEATRFKSVMHILLFDRFLFQAVDEARERGLVSREQGQRINREIFTAMVPIGEEEATEEGGVRQVLPPEEILASVHMYKGGNLLRLAFVAPLLIEASLREPLAKADRGIYGIGMALQVIDDLTDFYDDLRDRRHNYLVSSVQHEGSAAERGRLDQLLRGENSAQSPIDRAFAESASRVMQRAIGEALDGFDRLHEAGFWLTRPRALELIRYLFRLRGVGHLLRLLPADARFTENLDVRHAA
ncbi:hypothetical protein DESUT3_34160 [Desulfuromonas versatilis]|uniref:Thiopeptide-type bacteriocin biosynthesis domain-containing protein n=1 Tax=Desulfuromonas versatilis TaxID=2802975 RepID=A0ABM8I092_9BACT|nr:class 1 isoprenoid biosynthesis enzyme [Desulfuromonas versatilis]BCR06347.1 hypothetical protein DESUT3_34160 [Desulfuromonas versatilis]